MLEELFNLVKSHGTESVVNNAAVPNEHNEAVMAEATNSIAGGFQNILSGGGLQSILGLFGGGGNAATGNSGAMSLMNNPIVSMIKGHFMNKLMSKFGMNSGAANGVAGSLIPSVLGSLINKTNDSNDSSFNLTKIIGGLMGGNTAPAAANGASAGGFDLGGLLGKVMGGGLDQNNDGQTNLQDLMGLVTGGAQQAQQQQAQSGGGILDMLKGFMK
jgi:hypothetical protein